MRTTILRLHSFRHPALAIARDRNGLGESAAGEADRIDEWDGRALQREPKGPLFILKLSRAFTDE
ncbi:hypothetical protein KAM448_42300 [Aeromonas caviae]|uniref:Uncharacterized protein n=1 Tax=Aeromonas caviae TaxID=648 RepID=A0ABD0BD60_AERCA|nr:hypothetical protein KAM355_42650 [Aeromonas caviae]GJB13767.1 hypothetical protein KAM362_43270 [Aeromonas caviae]GJB26485.1 hypothetical protein KAM365_42350 [Aeromonas caviae]GJB35156.1 hypothetical protein KAM367_42580 [Aeromonas caviae]GJB43881.1 hypothetical protein KAM369_43560 [Aeromonas caviae]